MAALLALLALAVVPATCRGASANAKVTMLHCEYGSIELQPVPTPPGFETEFAMAVVEIDSPREIANAAVSGFSVIDRAGKEASLRRVVAVEEFGDYSIGAHDGVYAHYTDSPGKGPWKGTLPAGIIRLRIRVALASDPSGSIPGRCRVTVGQYMIEGPVDGEWRT